MTNRYKLFPTLYKYNKRGAIQEWYISVDENEDGTASYTTTYGQQGGAFQDTTVEVNTGKNIGRSNETTPFEQACSEAESKWKLQLDKGYAQGAPKPLPATSPMLAHPYEKKMDKVTFPCFWQPKLDGVRCIAHRIGNEVMLLSRKGKLFEALGHIEQVLLDIMSDGEILDGELYAHGVPFQTVISWIKRHQDDTKRVVYNVFDVINDKPFKERFNRICEIVGHNGRGVVRTVYTGKVNSHEDIRRTLEDQEKRGYEGIMLRVGDCKYTIGRRSSQLLKVKQFNDEEFIIVGAEENKGRQKGQCVFICKTNKGAQFKVKPMGTDAQRREFWTNRHKYIGKHLTVRFYEWTTSENPVPRFPIGVAVREDYE